VLISNQTILLISPESWGTNWVSKHHYAFELARMGNLVIFLNPPKGRLLTPKVHEVYEGLKILNYSAFMRGTNRLPKFLRAWFQKKDVAKIKKVIGVPINIVWTFDPYRFQDLSVFDAEFNIFHPVDYFSTSLKDEVAGKADMLISVSEQILDDFAFVKNKFLINHGVAEVFLTQPIQFKSNSKIHCGYVGNLLSVGLDQKVLKDIINQHGNIIFHLIGPSDQNNLTGKNKSLGEFVESVKDLSNVELHGALSPQDVARVIHGFDLFLVCYSEAISKIATNSHKILEYLSTGRVVVSSHIGSYANSPKGLLEMAKKNAELPTIFARVASRIDEYNTPELQQLRREFASNNSYAKQIIRIGALMEKIKNQKGANHGTHFAN